MQEPSLRSSRVAIAGGIAVTILVGGGGFLLGRATSDKATMQDQVAVAPVTQSASPASVPPQSRTIWGRADLIKLAEQAADTDFDGEPSQVLSAAIGKRFELRIPFGCGGRSDDSDASAMGWSYDEGTRTLRVWASANAWPPAAWWPSEAPASVAAIEGFWMNRPWSLSEKCPSAQSVMTEGGPQTAKPEQTLALGQVFTSEGSRQARRDGKPYEITQRLPDGAIDTSKGFWLKLTGRISTIPNSASPVLCRQPAGVEQRPICLIGVAIGQVTLENGADGTQIATWDTEPAAVDAGL